jgi:hypothetical protein
MASRVPNLSALPKGPARRLGSGPPGVVLAFLEQFLGFASAPDRPSEGRSSKGGRPTAPAAWTGRAPPGSSTLAQASCAGEITIGTHPSSRDVVMGGAAASGHGAPRGATESPPRVAADRPRSCDRLVGEGGNAPGPGRVECHRRSDHPIRTVLLSEAPSYILSGLQSDGNS